MYTFLFFCLIACAQVIYTAYAETREAREPEPLRVKVAYFFYLSSV